VWAKQWLYKQEHGKKAELPCPAKQAEELSAEDKLGYLSTQTWIMDRRNLVVVARRNQQVCR
jgi:hypothetical protein